jgi:hypothetical protein
MCCYGELWPPRADVVTFLALLAGMHLAPAVAQGQPKTYNLNDSSSVASQAQSAWSEYRIAAYSLQGDVRMKLLALDGPGGNDVDWHFKQNPKCKMQRIDFREDNKRSILIRCQNSQYSFEIRKRKPEAAWYLAEYKPGMTANYVNIARLLDLIHVHATSLEMLFAQPRFQITKISLDAGFGPEYVRIEFENERSRQSTSQEFCPIRRGMLILDTSNYWCLRKAKVEADNGDARGTIEVSNEYVSDSGFPIPKQVTHRLEYNNPDGTKIGSTGTTIHDLVKTSTLPDEAEFTLSAFGMPEPQGIVWDRKPRYHLWIIGTGAVLLAMGLLIHRRLRLKKQQGAVA